MTAGPRASLFPVAKVYSVLRLLVLLGVVGYLAWHIVSGWAAVQSLLGGWDWLHLIGALGAGVLAYQCLFLGWLVLLRRIGYFQSRYLSVYSRIWWMSYLYRYTPGKVLLLVERARMGVAVGIPPAPGAALAIIETMFSILAAAWVSLLALSYYGDNQHWFLGFVAVLSIGMLFLLPMGYRLVCGLQAVRSRYPELAAITLSPTDVLTVIPLFLGHFVFLGLSFYLCVHSLHLVSWSAFPGLCGVYALSHLVGLVTMIAPAGLGVREGALSVQLGYVLSSGAAEVVAVGARIWFTLVELLSFGVVMLCCQRLPDSDSPSDPHGDLSTVRGDD